VASGFSLHGGRGRDLEIPKTYATVVLGSNFSKLYNVSHLTTIRDAEYNHGMPLIDADYLSLDEIADKFGLNVETPRRWVRDGKLEAVRVGRSYRVPKAAFEAFLQSHHLPVTNPPTGSARSGKKT
jgi:excisionase family DNA binding protein